MRSNYEKVKAATGGRIGYIHVPNTAIEGMQEFTKQYYPHSRIQGDANVLIFPDLAAGNIGYQIVKRLSRAEVIGPILMGMRRPVSVLTQASTAAEIVNLAAITAVAADPDNVRSEAAQALVGTGR